MTFCRKPSLPLLPVYSYNPDVGKTYFGKYQHFYKIQNEPIYKEKQAKRLAERYPSVYHTGDISELPVWITLDKKILVFDTYFEDKHMGGTIRNCKLYFYLDDGTIKIVEPKTENIGIPQGTLLYKQSVRLPPPKDHLFYDIVDFNIGNVLDIYGKKFKLVNCDQFTRNFLNRIGIAVNDPIDVPKSHYELEHERKVNLSQKPKPKKEEGSTTKFIKYDKKILRFYGYWDDRSCDGGYLHHLILLYYLVDDTIEINEVNNHPYKKNTTFPFLKRLKLLKEHFDVRKDTVGDGCMNINTFVKYPTNEDFINVRYYEPRDLQLGGCINVYGRKVILTDADQFTKDYYRDIFDIPTMKAIEKPKEQETLDVVPVRLRKLPPYNGFGSYEDSAQNCISFEPKQIMRDVKKFLQLDRNGINSHILRFKACMQTTCPIMIKKNYIICYYLCDDTISVHELYGNATGPTFLKRAKIRLPGEKVFVVEPHYYDMSYFYVGGVVDFHGTKFILIEADEYALQYMESHCAQFPKSNIKLIMDKIRSKLQPIYKSFVAQLLPSPPESVSYLGLRDKLKLVMGDDWTEQEIITLGRHYAVVNKLKKFSRHFIRQAVVTQLKKYLWDITDTQRMKEYFRKYDTSKTGFMEPKKVYTIIKACRLPIEKSLIEAMIDVLEKNVDGNVNQEDFFHFIDYDFCPPPDIPPLNLKDNYFWPIEPDPYAGQIINWQKFLEDLDLEKTLNA